ncbi:MAG: septal ring lytic transglycosylase RlpA family protein [Pseudomonadota bacterium]
MVHDNSCVLCKAGVAPESTIGKEAVKRASAATGAHRNGRSLGWFFALAILAAGLLSGCATKPLSTPYPASEPRPSYRGKAPYNRPYTVRGKRYYPMATARGYRERGTASWYGWESGNRTAMGTRFNPKGLTAAHKTLPLPTRVKVTNLRNGRSIVVLVNDRGPFVKNRIIDLSYGAARAIGIRGLGRVLVESLEGREAAYSPPGKDQFQTARFRRQE